MAASDPTPGVPTPTGTLQGVAAFSWDGTTWQPTAGAGPDVATPTGVLRGVAPFSWDGAAWQPAGKAQPGVAAPGGVLDGVAVYTWSGSAWTPASGQPTPSTPSGALRGVAAFTWDGAAWQPAGRAGPSVATPYGVLDGVAMFNWTGAAWTPGPALALSFMTPGSLDPRITLTRASTATYFDVTGTMQTAAVNAARWDYDPVTHVLRGMLIEEQRGNAIFPSVPNTGGNPWQLSGPTTQGGSVTAPNGTTATASLIAASDTTNSFRAIAYATGGVAAATAAFTVTAFLKTSASSNAFIQCNMIGGAGAIVAYYDLTNGVAVVGADLSAGPTNKSATISRIGNGWYRASFTFTTPTGTSAITPYIGPCTTVSGSGDNRSAVGVIGQGIYVWGAQIEAGAFPTSYIPTTSGVVTRAIDSCTIPPANMGWFVAPGGSWFAEFVDFQTVNTRIIGYPTSGQVTPMYINGTNQLAQYDAAIVVTSNAITDGSVMKGASTYAPGTGRVCLNGGAIASAAMTTGYGLLNTGGISIMSAGSATVGENTSGYIRGVRYWPRILSDAEMQAVTT
jgi:hypothetical protein